MSEIFSSFQRMLTTMNALRRGSKLTTQQVRDRLSAQGYKVTVRTVQRDLEWLAQTYGVECDDRSKPYGWRWPQDAPVVSLPGMGWPEVLSFNLLGQNLRGLLPGAVAQALQPYFNEADRKLGESSDQIPLRDWPKRIRLLPSGQTLLTPRVSSA
ncbi:MAG: hypothetical protein RI907_338, partial [Pseudomonadota bacterium]